MRTRRGGGHDLQGVAGGGAQLGGQDVGDAVGSGGRRAVEHDPGLGAQGEGRLRDGVVGEAGGQGDEVEARERLGRVGGLGAVPDLQLVQGDAVLSVVNGGALLGLHLDVAPLLRGLCGRQGLGVRGGAGGADRLRGPLPGLAVLGHLEVVGGRARGLPLDGDVVDRRGTGQVDGEPGLVGVVRGPPGVPAGDAVDRLVREPPVGQLGARGGDVRPGAGQGHVVPGGGRLGGNGRWGRRERLGRGGGRQAGGDQRRRAQEGGGSGEASAPRRKGSHHMLLCREDKLANVFNCI